MIRPGHDWGTAADGAPDVEVAGDDTDLAAAVAAHSCALIRFSPSPRSDLARAVGLDPRRNESSDASPGPPLGPSSDESPDESGPGAGFALPLDALRLGDGALCVNMAVSGTPPDRLRRLSRRVFVTVVVDGTPWFSGRATTVVIATGEFLRGRDVVPRGHPGDGRAEIQVYAAEPGERAGMRARLGTGTHVPHPRIAQRVGRRIEVRWARPRPLEIDGRAHSGVAVCTFETLPAAYRLLL